MNTKGHQDKVNIDIFLFKVNIDILFKVNIDILFKVNIYTCECKCLFKKFMGWVLMFSERFELTKEIIEL